MKRLSSIIFQLSMSVVLLLLMASCSKNQATKLIPEDAIVVVRLDVAKMQEKAGLKDSKSGLKEWVKEQIENSDISKELSEKVLAIVDDPTASGIDFTEPVYFYFSGDMRSKVDAGLVGAVASKGDLTDLMEALTEEMGGKVEVEEADGGEKYVYANGTALIYNGDWFYFGQSNDIDETIETLKERADGKGSLSGNKAFAQMEEKEGLMQFLFLGSGLEEILEEMKTNRNAELAMKNIEDMLPDGIKLEDISSLTDFALNDGELLLTCEVPAPSDKMKEQIDKYDELSKDIDKELAQYSSGEMLNLFVNADAMNFFKSIKPMLKEEMGREELDVIESLVKDFDGSLALDLYAFNEEGQPQLSVYAGTKSNKGLAFIVQNLGEEIDSLDTDEYLIPIKEYDWFEETYTVKSHSGLGYKDGMTYYVSNPDYAFEVPGEEFPAKELKGKGFYARFNFGFFDNLAKMVGDEEGEIFEKIADTYDYAEAYYEGGGKGVFRITTKDKKTNPVQALFKLIEEYI